MFPTTPKSAGTIQARAFAAFVSIGLLANVVLPASGQASGTWAVTGSLNTSRAGHTATLLPIFERPNDRCRQRRTLHPQSLKEGGCNRAQL